jgi:membrane protease YdiL (CAAX protease family)
MPVASTNSETVGQFIFFAVAVAGGVLWMRWLARCIRGRTDWMGRDQSPAAAWGLLDVLGAGLLWIFAQAVAASAWSSVSGTTPESPRDATIAGILAGMLSLAVALGVLLYFAFRYGHRSREFGFGRGQLAGGVLRGLAGFAMWVPVVWLVHEALSRTMPYSHETLDRLEIAESPLLVAGIWFSAILVSPTVEEVLFRGVLQGWLQRIRRHEPGVTADSMLFGRASLIAQPAVSEMRTDQPIHWPAIVVAATVFGLAHSGQGAAPVSLFVLSLGHGYLYQRTGSLLACIVMHAALILVTLVVFSL